MSSHILPNSLIKVIHKWYIITAGEAKKQSHAWSEKMEAAQFSEVFIFSHHTTWHNHPENHELYLHSNDNLKSHK
jgi:hypothetical protein